MQIPVAMLLWILCPWHTSDSVDASCVDSFQVQLYSRSLLK